MAVWYRAGTVTVTSGSKNVTGVDTLWLSQAAVGDVFTLNGSQLYEIEAIGSNTTLTLKTSYGQSTASNQTYAIIRNFTSSVNAVLAAKLADVLNKWHLREDDMLAWLLGDDTTTLTSVEGIQFTVDTPQSLQKRIRGVLAKTINTANVTLTSSEAKNTFINLSGTLTGDRALIVPAVASHLFIVTNSTSGAFTVTVRTPSGTGIVVPQGGRRLLWCDGTNVLDAMPHVSGLGTAATANVTTSATDTTAGRVLKVGDFGLGRAPSDGPSVADLNTVTRAGFYQVNASAANRPAEGGANAALLVIGGGFSERTTQLFSLDANSNRYWMRNYTGSSWTSWRELYHTGNISTIDATTNQIFRVNDTERMRIDSAGRVGIGATPSNQNNIILMGSRTTSPNHVFGINNQIGSSDISTEFTSYNAFPSTPSGGACHTVNYYRANQSTLESSVVNQYGFNAVSTLTGATNNYGFYSNIASGTGRWNFYANGTAANYFAGETRIGGNGSTTGIAISGDVGATITHRTNTIGQLDINHQPQDETSAAFIRLFRNTSTTGTVAFQVMLGDGTTVANHTLNARNNQTSYLCSNNGFLRVGSTAAATCMLSVTGGIATSRTAVTSPAASDGNVFSGTYTPTLTNQTNVASSTASVLQYMRVGNSVTVSGQVTIAPTATGNTLLGLSLPIASSLTNTTQVGGTAVSQTTTQVAAIYADTTNNRATIRLQAAATTSLVYSFSFTYQVI